VTGFSRSRSGCFSDRRATSARCRAKHGTTNRGRDLRWRFGLKRPDQKIKDYMGRNRPDRARLRTATCYEQTSSTARRYLAWRSPKPACTKQSAQYRTGCEFQCRQDAGAGRSGIKMFGLPCERDTRAECLAPTTCSCDPCGRLSRGPQDGTEALLAGRNNPSYREICQCISPASNRLPPCIPPSIWTRAWTKRGTCAPWSRALHSRSACPKAGSRHDTEWLVTPLAKSLSSRPRGERA